MQIFLKFLTQPAVLVILFCIFSHCIRADVAAQPDSPASSGIATMSVDKATAVIEKAYIDILKRKPDESGLNSFTQILTRENRDETWLRKTLRDSREFRDKAKKKRRKAIIITVFTAIPALLLLITFLRRRNMKDFIFKVILLAGSIAVICLAMEIFLRVKAGIEAKRNIDAFHKLAQLSVPPPGSTATLKDIIYLSSNPKIVYELIPGLSVKFMGAQMTSGRDGFRTTPGSSDSTNSFCIIGLGDSVMFGWGVRDEETYLVGLCRHLSSQQPGRQVRMINMSVPGYNTVMEVETLKRKGLQYRPKLVLIHFVENDLGLPNFISMEDPDTKITKSHLYSAVSRMLGDNVATKPFDSLVRSPDEIPEKYRNLAGEAACTAALKELGSMAREHGFKVIVLSEWNAPGFVRKAVNDSGMSLVELGSTMNDYCRANNIREYLGSVLTISRKDPHYSPLAHKLVCDRIINFLEEKKLMDTPDSTAVGRQ